MQRLEIPGPSACCMRNPVPFEISETLDQLRFKLSEFVLVAALTDYFPDSDDAAFLAMAAADFRSS